MKTRIVKPEFFSLKNTVLSHGWVNLHPYTWGDNELNGTVEIEGKAFGYSVSESKKTLLLDIDCRPTNPKTEKIVSLVQYALSFDFPSLEFIDLCLKLERKDLAVMAEKGWGRLLRGLTPWEDAVKTLLTTNCTWSNTQKMVYSLCSTFGRRTTNSGKYTFPSPNEILQREDELTNVRLGYRAKYLLDLTRKVCSGKVDLTKCLNKNGNNLEEVSKRLFSLKGFGDYAVNHLLVLYDWYNFIPLDREVMKYLKIDPVRKTKTSNNISLYSEFSDFRFVAYKLERIAGSKNWIGG